MEYVFVLGTVLYCRNMSARLYFCLLDAQTASNFRTDEQYFSVIKNLDGDTATGLTVALIMIADVQTV